MHPLQLLLTMSLLSYAANQTVFNMDFKVYTVGLYVEAEAAQKSPHLTKYAHQTVQQLSESPDFYKTMSTAADFDRTLFIKLAMALKKETLVKGLVNEMHMLAKNKVSFFFYLDIEVEVCMCVRMCNILVHIVCR